MKNKKRCFETCSFYDYTGMEARLEKMAAEGWMIERISSFGWVYRRIEPARLHFAVTFYPKASGFDPGLTEGQRAFQDYCRHTGWQPACTSAQMQIFCHEGEHPIPLETDPTVKADTIHRAAKRSFLPAYFLLLAVAVLQCALFFIGIRNDPIRILSSPSAPCTGVAWIILFFLCASEITGYYRWHARAVKAAARGEFINTNGRSWRLRILLFLIVPFVLYWLAAILTTAPVSIRVITVFAFLYYAVALNAVILTIREFLKRRKAPRNVNRTVTLLSAVFLTLFLAGAILFAVLHSEGFGQEEAGQETYEYNGRIWTVRQDELPLTLEDLLEAPPASNLYIREHSGNESLLLGQYDMRQHPRFDAENFSELPDLDYTITQIKFPALYQLCLRSLLGDPGMDSVWLESDAAPWGAREAYQLYGSDSRARNRYLLCYPNRIVEIGFGWEPAPDQMRAAGQKCGG